MYTCTVDIQDKSLLQGTRNKSHDLQAIIKLGSDGIKNNSLIQITPLHIYYKIVSDISAVLYSWYQKKKKRRKKKVLKNL